MTTATPTSSVSLAEALGNEAVQALPQDQIKNYLEQRLTAVRVTLMEAVTNRALTAVSSDLPDSQRDAQIAQYDRQIASLHSCVAQLEGALQT